MLPLRGLSMEPVLFLATTAVRCLTTATNFTTFYYVTIYWQFSLITLLLFQTHSTTPVYITLALAFALLFVAICLAWIKIFIFVVFLSRPRLAATDLLAFSLGMLGNSTKRLPYFFHQRLYVPYCIFSHVVGVYFIFHPKDMVL